MLQRSRSALVHPVRIAIAASLGLTIATLTAGGSAHAGSFVVTTAASSGAGSLAEAVEQANASPDASTITFAPSVTGTINTDEVPEITADLTITGNGIDATKLTSTDGTTLVLYEGDDLTVTDLSVVEPKDSPNSDGPGTGFYIDGSGRAEFRRLVFTEVAYALSINSFGDAVIDDVSIEGIESHAAELTTGATARITDLTMDGIGEALIIDNVADVTLERVESRGATSDGIEIVEVETLMATDIEMVAGDSNSNNTSGFALRQVVNATIEGLEVSEWAGRGVRLGEIDRLDATNVFSRLNRVGLEVGGDTNGTIDFVSLVNNTYVGVEASDVTGEVTISRANIAENGTDNSTGAGGVYVHSGGTADASLTVNRTRIADNYGTDNRAGGVTLRDTDTSLIVTESTLSNNEGALAEAALAYSGSSSGELRIEQSTVKEHINDPDAENRGLDDPIFRATNTDLTIENSTIVDNHSRSALVLLEGSRTVRLDRSTMVDNSLYSSAPGLLIQNNAASRYTVRDSILTRNNAANVIARNGADVSRATFDYTVLPSNSTIAGIALQKTDDPMLSSLGDFGGPTETMRPLPDSIVVDNGTSTSGENYIDQRGFRRLDDRVDIGAVELQSSPFVTGVAPARVLETRSGEQTIDGRYDQLGRLADGAMTTLPITGRADVPSDARAVVVNITAIAPIGNGFITAHSCAVYPPLASSLNFTAGLEAGNEIVVELDDDGAMCLFNRGETHLAVDVVGYVPNESAYQTVRPARLVDTREAGSTIDGRFAALGKRASGSTLVLDVAGRGGVRHDASAVVVNVTAVAPDGPGFVTVYACEPNPPVAASLNFTAGINRGNEIVAGLDDDGRMCLFVQGTAHLTVDVVGQLDFEVDYESIEPARLLETRSGLSTVDGRQQSIGRVAGPSVVRVETVGRAGLPAGTDSVVVNVTAIKPDGRGFITAWDCDETMPLAASLNYAAGAIVGNELIVDIDDAGEFCLFSNRSTDLTVDVVGALL